MSGHYIPLSELFSTPGAWDAAWEKMRATCGPHRGPQGPNEDIAQCPRCLMPSYSRRPAGETFGDHLPDCSLPMDHEGYCRPGGSGHPAARTVRGFWPGAA